ncbi:RNA-directed DNA polymerase, eukaryota, reverse transcriptase zinc-binding domain protein [Tanacetum coccineum]
MVLSMKNQDVFCLVEVLQSNVKFYCTFVYAGNSGIERRILWKELETQKNIVGNLPWLVLGDFNVTMDSSEHSSGGSFRTLDVTTRNFPISNLAVCVKCLAWKSLLDLGEVLAWTSHQF